MATARTGDTVHVHYTGRLRDGSIFDTSVDGDPLAFTLGADDVIAGFDRGVEGMAEGEKKTIEVPADEGYGAYRDDLTVTVDRAQFPPDIAPEIGQQFQLGMEDGGTLAVTVVEVDGDTVTLDANHPLAGQDLVFTVELVAILTNRN